MTMMEEELSFPRGGHHQRRSEPPNKEDNDNKRSRKEKRKSTEEGDAPSIKTDFLFGTKSKKNDEKSSSKRRKKDESTDVSGSSNKHSMLPLGGGGVVMSTKRLHTKKGSSSKDMITSTTAVTPVIEALSFSKFAKGTKVLACVRQVQDEFAIVSLPNLLTAYILPQDPFPLKHTLTVGQTLAVVIQKVATEQVKGGASRKRIQVTPLPQAVNPRSLLMGDDTHSSKTSTLASAANRLSKSSIPVRGQIMSIEDHGCVVDLGFGARGFVKFEDIHEGDQNYVILEDDDEQEESQRDNEGEEKSTLLLQKGRLYDFLVLPVSTSSSKEQSTTVFPLCLPSTRKFADQTVSNLSPNASGSGRHKKSKDSTSSPVSLSSLTPGWLVQVKVEALATNGLCVSFFGNVFRGAMEINHLGATLVPSTKDGMSKDGGWKSLAASLFQKHQTFFARILAVDVPTKLVRLSMAPHVLNLGHATDPDSSLNGFPRMGTVVPDCTVIKLDPGIGVLLALPSQFNYTEAEVMISESLRKSSELFSDSTFQEACRVRKVYVHISKALDEAEEGEGKNSAFAGKFHKEFAPSTTHSVRILSTGHWIEGIAAGACAPSIVGAHVLSHDDLVAGKVYKQVPVCAHMQGGSILVQLGGAVQKRKKKKGDTHRGITGLIPPEQLFDTTSSGSSEYRKRVVQTKFAVDAKVDVRVLWVDPVRKKCLVTAKRTIVQAPTDQIITSYNDLKVGQVAVGFISRIDDDNMFVTFCNKVYGRVTARSLATELGVENHKENYCVGDAVSCRVVTLKRVYAKEQRSISSDDFETENAEESTIARTTSRPDYWELILSLKAKTANGEETISDAGNIDIQHPEQIRLLPGAILPKKSMKIVKLVDGRSKKAGGYTPGYAVVVIKSKYLMDESNPNRAKMTETVECKLPYDQLVDRYNPIDIQDVKTMDEMAMRLLVVGKKINQKGIVLLDPNKSNVEYSSGLGRMPVVSLRKQMIVAQEQQDGDSDADDDNMPIVPSPSTELFVGALVLGFVTHIDPRHGGFVRFLGGMTGLIPKKQGGLRLPLFNTVIARVKVIDDSFTPHRILLELHSDQNRVESDGAANESVEVGDELLHAKVSDVAFFQATFQVAGRKSKQEKFIMHCTSKEANASIIKHRKKPLSPDGSHRITKSHPFYGIEKGHEFGRLLVVGVKRRKNRVDVFVTDKNVDSDSVQDQDSSLHFIEDPLQLKTGMKTKAIVVGYAVENKGVIVQVGPSVRGFIPGLELSRDLNVLNNLAANIPLGAVLECRVLDRELWFRCRMSCPLPSFYLKQLKKGLGKKDLDHNSLYLSVLACDAQSRVPSRPSEGDLVIGRINRSLPQIQAPSLMIELRGGFVGRCCITELNEPDEWTNMPLGNPKRTATRNREEILDSQGENETDEKKDNTDDEKDLQDQIDGEYGKQEYVECRILSLNLVSNQIDASLRPSRVQGDLDDDPEPQVGDVVQGYVVTTNKKGCFVRMSRTVEGRSTIKEICDGFLPNPEAAFPAGRLVVGKVKSTRAVQKNGNHPKDSIRLQVDLDMRESVLLQEQENQLSYQDIAVGDKLKGTVQRVEDYGVFVRIDNSNLSGLSHVSECSDDFVKNLSALFNPGDPVKVLVIKKDDEHQKLGFSMKASHFEDDDDSSESSVDSDMEIATDDEDVEMKDVPERQEDTDDEEGDDDIDSDDENFASKLAAKMDGENDSAVQESDSDDSVEGSESSSEDEKLDVLDTNVGFAWSAKALEKIQANAGGKEIGASDDSDSDSDSEDDEDDDNGPSKSHKSRKRQAQRRREEQETSRREMALADGTADENPETAGDFERLLAGDPNNSELWIRYMAFHLSLADIPSARRVADKALERIEFRQEREKLNVWGALLQLEHKYGSEETFQAAIDRACKQNNSKQVYLRACEIMVKDLESNSNEPNTVSRVDNLFTTMCRKHKSKKKSWLAHMHYLLKHARHQEAHALMKRAMLSLAPYKHAETMCKFAQMEFELGSPERGRTLFDGLLVKYPKRLDMFFVYLDKEIKYGNINHARSMLEKKVDERKLSDKQMKSLFKKWYKIEEEYGTEETQEHVKESARKYVSSGRQ